MIINCIKCNKKFNVDNNLIPDQGRLLKCGKCGNMLDATFEVDHKIELQDGGTNHVDNLWALCPNCHRQKGLMNKIQQ